MKPVLVLFASLVLAFATGFLFGRDSVQSANDLLKAGFTIVDPEGFPIKSFE